ncbi:redoxin family protein [Pedobacter gandavensis]|uniref:redoxin family protein n=1 Tax=Pedobacter gandavensis TaxID=2679963 RepID=UPI002931C04C|nr:redoxin family protein [Pedobacter gandavensis]
MKKFLLFALLISSSLLSQAITSIKGTIKTSKDRRFLISLSALVPFSSDQKPLSQEVKLENRNSFSLKTNLKTAGFYNLSVVMEQQGKKSVHNSTLYLSPNLSLNLEYLPHGDFGLVCNYVKIKEVNNQTLQEIQEKYNQQIRMMFAKTPDTLGLKADLNQFLVIANTTMNQKKLSPEVKRFLELKAFDTYQSNLFRFSSDYLRLMKGKAEIKTDYFTYSGPSSFLSHYQDPLIQLFPNATYNLIRHIEIQTTGTPFNKKKSSSDVSTAINWLKTQQLPSAIVDDVARYLLSAYTGTYKVSTDFDKDLKAFRLLAENIKNPVLKNKISSTFENLRYTMKGASIPPVSFENVAGDTITLEQFKGKYLFIDLWASWCVPCIKMTPFVQQLEKQYEGRNINFVAISIDANRQNWLSKMKNLQLHGHQFLDLQGEFAKQLNITGIPHYLIYDQQGKLLIFQTDMPDNPKLKALIDTLPGL